MIVYEANKEQFLDDVKNQRITNKIHNEFQKRFHHKTSKQEIASWENSMKYMYFVMEDENIPMDSEVAIEYRIPNTSKRIDFIIAGHGDDKKENAVIVELKQWTEVEALDGDGVVLSDEFEEVVGQHANMTKEDLVESTEVRTITGGALRIVSHPSYQVYSYYKVLTDFNESIQRNDIKLVPCTFLHNYEIKENNDPLTDVRYQMWIDKAPVFVKGDVEKLSSFISKYIKYGDGKQVLYDIDCGKIKPSKALQDSVASMLKGKEEFVMIDEQKVVFELAKDLAHKCMTDNMKRVLVVEGGPGTGKTVLAMNLLATFLKEEMNACYVSKNAAPRNVFAQKLADDNIKKVQIKNLFHGSGEFINSKNNDFDVILVDEAHRLNEKSGLFANLGENQIGEIINASKLAIFFLDESQRVTLKDIGRITEIEKFCFQYETGLVKTKLESQFRCNGSDAYLSWLDDVLNIRKTANDILDLEYDFKIFDDPNEMRKEIEEKNKINNKSRIVAGYCWNWISDGKNKSDVHDIVIPDYDFEISWNLGNSSTWAIDPLSVKEAGCIHTCQGLEFDYVGVIIGKDLIYEDGEVVSDFTKRASTDQSLKGIKQVAIKNPQRAQEVSDIIIKNTYRTLMTRGQKGCYVYCEDKALAEYLKNRIK